LDKKHSCEHVPKSEETSQGKVTVLWNQQINLIELSPATIQKL